MLLPLPPVRILILASLGSTKVLLVDARVHIHIHSAIIWGKVLRKLVLIDLVPCWEAITVSL